MYALAYFMIGIAAINLLGVVSANVGRKSRELSIASQLAASKLEELRVTSFDDLTGSTSTYYDQYGGERGSNVDRFEVTWTATVDPGGVFTDVEVRTLWGAEDWVLNTQDDQPKSYSVTMNSRVFRR